MVWATHAAAVLLAENVPPPHGEQVAAELSVAEVNPCPRGHPVTVTAVQLVAELVPLLKVACNVHARQEPSARVVAGNRYAPGPQDVTCTAPHA